jgi:hypothetical protein
LDPPTEAHPAAVVSVQVDSNALDRNHLTLCCCL